MAVDVTENRQTGITMVKRPTIADIAREAGVSIGAVSYALNGRPGVSPQTRKKIIAIADQIEWRPNASARALSVSRAGAVGLVVVRPSETIGVEPFYMRLISGMESELAQFRSALLLQLVDSRQDAIRITSSWWAERRVDGVFVTDVRVDDERLVALEEMGIPSVQLGRPQPGSQVPGVWSDGAPPVKAVVDYLYGLGHRRIARIAGEARLDHTEIRNNAFITAMHDHGLADPEVVPTDYSWEQGAQATRTLLGRPQPPTAIIFDNDVMAVAGVGAAGDMGVSVPEELSVVAGEDSQLCELINPAITALTRDVVAYGFHAARTLMDVIEGKNPGSYQVATSELVRRASSAVAR